MTTLQESNIGDDAHWIAIAPSRICFVLTLVAALVALAVLIALATAGNSWLSREILWALIVVLAIAIAWQMVRMVRRSPTRAVAIYLLPRDSEDRTQNNVLGIRLRLADATEQTGYVAEGGFVTPLFTTVAYRLDRDPVWRRRWPRVLPLWRDALDRDQFRRVRVRLKWH
jgi:hypothetical protein